MSLYRQLEELQLVKCSLLPGEEFNFSEDCEVWTKLLDSYTETPDQVDPHSVLPTTCFQINLQEWKSVWFAIELPRGYPENGSRPIVTVRMQGDDFSRADQERWKDLVGDKLNEVLAEHRDSG